MRLAEPGEAGGGIAYPAVSVAIQRFEKRLQVDRELRRKLIVKDSDVIPFLRDLC
jgi:hypothetical protein